MEGIQGHLTLTSDFFNKEGMSARVKVAEEEGDEIPRGMPATYHVCRIESISNMGVWASGPRAERN